MQLAGCSGGDRLELSVQHMGQNVSKRVPNRYFAWGWVGRHFVICSHDGSFGRTVGVEKLYLRPGVFTPGREPRSGSTRSPPRMTSRSEAVTSRSPKLPPPVRAKRRLAARPLKFAIPDKSAKRPGPRPSWRLVRSTRVAPYVSVGKISSTLMSKLIEANCKKQVGGR